MEDNLYIIKTYGANGSTLLKVGYSSNMFKRLETYKSHNPLCEVVHTAYREDAKKFELYLHGKYPASFGREWYEVSMLDTFINEFKSGTIEEKLVGKNNTEKPISFVSAYTGYAAQLRSDIPDFDVIENILSTYPIVTEAYDVLGCEKVKALKYRKSYVTNELVKLSKLDDVSKVYKLIDTYKYRAGAIIPTGEIKEDVQGIFTSLGIDGKAKATDINRYYNTKTCSKYIDGKKTACHLILDCKFKVS